jgi:ABC transporter
MSTSTSPGDTVLVSGRNGAGKSTLLRVLAGLLRPRRGTVLDRPAVVGWLRTGRKVDLTVAMLRPPGLLVMDEPGQGLDRQGQDEIPQLVTAPAYAFSAILLFAAFCWQTNVVLDTEPDEQRLLALLGVGTQRRELVAGLLAAAGAAAPAVAFGVLAPAGIGPLALPPGGAAVPWLLFGPWVHGLAAVCVSVSAPWPVGPSSALRGGRGWSSSRCRSSSSCSAPGRTPFRVGWCRSCSPPRASTGPPICSPPPASRCTHSAGR